MGLLVGKDKKVEVSLGSLTEHVKERRVDDAVRKEAARKACEEESSRKAAARSKRSAAQGGLANLRAVVDAEPAGESAGTAACSPAGKSSGTAADVENPENVEGDGGEA